MNKNIIIKSKQFSELFSSVRKNKQKKPSKWATLCCTESYKWADDGCNEIMNLNILPIRIITKSDSEGDGLSA